MAPLLNPAVVGGGGTAANIDDGTYAAAYPASVSAAAQPPPAAGPGDAASSSSSRPPPPWPTLELDSGASIHVVGDARLLSNLRDAPAGKTIMVADGNTLPVTKIGDIQMVNPAFTIPGVYLAPGLKADLISVRQLTRRRICTWFDGDRAVLYVGRELVGEAIAPKENPSGLYVLQFLSVPKEVPAAASSFGNNDLDMMSVPKVPPAASSSGNNGLEMSVPKVPETDSSSGNNSLDNGEIKLVPVSCGSKSTRGSFGSVLCRLKALLRVRQFCAGRKEKPMREPHVSNRNQMKGKNSGR